MRSARHSSTVLLRFRRLDSLELTASSANLCSDTGPTSSRLGQRVSHTSHRQLRMQLHVLVVCATSSLCRNFYSLTVNRDFGMQKASQ